MRHLRLLRGYAAFPSGARGSAVRIAPGAPGFATRPQPQNRRVPIGYQLRGPEAERGPHPVVGSAYLTIVKLSLTPAERRPCELLAVMVSV
jgi:hypothetical protein